MLSFTFQVLITEEPQLPEKEIEKSEQKGTPEIANAPAEDRLESSGETTPIPPEEPEKKEDLQKSSELKEEVKIKEKDKKEEKKEKEKKAREEKEKKDREEKERKEREKKEKEERKEREKREKEEKKEAKEKEKREQKLRQSKEKIKPDENDNKDNKEKPIGEQIPEDALKRMDTEELILNTASEPAAIFSPTPPVPEKNELPGLRTSRKVIGLLHTIIGKKESSPSELIETNNEPQHVSSDTVIFGYLFTSDTFRRRLVSRNCAKKNVKSHILRKFHFKSFKLTS